MGEVTQEGEGGELLHFINTNQSETTLENLVYLEIILNKKLKLKFKI